MCQHSSQNIEGNVGPSVAHVRCVINRWATAIPFYEVAILRNEKFLKTQNAFFNNSCFYI